MSSVYLAQESIEVDQRVLVEDYIVAMTGVN